MTDPISSVRPEFFGKDSFVPFIGFVEDVNDPKQSHRVKVRCIGWHPKSKPGNESSDQEDALSTDDLPWARVAMPTTHAQQDRIGGKHGLLPGCCVFGCFLDGEETQDPLVLASLNFTAKASDKNNREELQGKKGKVEQTDKTFQKSYNPDRVNTNRRTEQEKGKETSDQNDPAGDTTLNDADGTKCGGKAVLESAASKTRKNAENTKETPEAQNTDTLQADGMCGTIAHAQEDIQKKIQELMPSEMSRFTYGDAVWSKFSGKYVDLNGIMAQLAVIICNEMKMPINSSKSFMNEIQRKVKSTVIQATPDRDGFIREKVEKGLSIKDDLFNGIFQKSFVDILCSLMMNMLTAMNNSSDDEQNDNEKGNRGNNVDTPITNVRAKCISQTIVNNTAIMTDAALVAALATAENKSEDMQNNGGSAEDIMGAVMGILGGLQSVMQFPMIMKYAMRPDVFNAAGNASQDILTKGIGCRQDRSYNTEMGAMGSLMGFSGAGGGGGGGGGEGGGSEGGGSGYGSDNSRGLTRYQNIGFGGTAQNEVTGEMTNDLCDEAYQIPYKDGEEKPEFVETVFNTTVDGSRPNGSRPRLDDPYIKLPGGSGGVATPISLPSMDEICAKNFINGTPNQVIITRRGVRYYFNNDKDVYKTFPSIYIPGYQGTPVPVVDRESGELVAILTNCKSFDPNRPNANISIIPDNNETGITTDDPQYDITLGGFFIANTGFEYCDPKIRIFDRDKGIYSNADAKLTVVNGRIVDYDIINNGTAFKRIPDIEIYDDGTNCGTTGGFGAKLYPIMSVVDRESKPGKPKLPPVNMVYCPSNQENLY